MHDNKTNNSVARDAGQTPTLIANDGCLYTDMNLISDELTRKHFRGENPILIAEYEEGDCDTVCWPNPEEKTLRMALLRAIEIGLIPSNTRSVILPDGSTFIL